MSIGLSDRSPLHPREVLADAVADHASGIIVAHNPAYSRLRVGHTPYDPVPKSYVLTFVRAAQKADACALVAEQPC